jgi:hypothetical protein
MAVVMFNLATHRRLTAQKRSIAERMSTAGMGGSASKIQDSAGCNMIAGHYECAGSMRWCERSNKAGSFVGGLTDPRRNGGNQAPRFSHCFLRRYVLNSRRVEGRAHGRVAVGVRGEPI